MDRTFAGIWSGLIATGPMTLSFFKFFENFANARKKSLPPSQLTKSLQQRVGYGPDSQLGHANLTMAMHFLYGAGTGLVYSQTAARLPAHRLLKGTLFGFGVWGASYLGWIPAMNLKPQARAMNIERNVMLVVSHLVWGISLAYAEDQLRSQGKNTFNQKMLSR